MRESAWDVNWIVDSRGDAEAWRGMGRIHSRYKDTEKAGSEWVEKHILLILIRLPIDANSLPNP